MADRPTRLSFTLLSAAGLAVLCVATARAVSAGIPHPGRLAETCARALVPQPSLAWAATIVLAGLVAVSVAHAGRAVRAVARTTTGVHRLDADRSTLRGRDVRVVRTPRAVAFCAGLRRPRIHLSTATIGLLDERQLDAVIAHEDHHAQRRDPLRMAIRQVVVRALFFVPGLARLAAHLDELAEQAADEHAVRAAGGDVRPLAGALLTLDAAGAPAGAGISPARVDRLTGAPPAWTLPRRRIAAATAVLLTVAGLLAASAPIGTAVAAALHVCLMSIVALGTLTSPLAAALTART